MRRPQISRTLDAPSTIRAFFLLPWVRELNQYGLDIDSFLREYRLAAVELTNLYQEIPLRNFVAIAEDLSVRLNRPLLGLELGRQFTVADLGPFYAVFLLARNLRTALTSLARYQASWQTNTVLRVVRDEETSACQYIVQDPSIWPRRQDAEFVMASLATLIRQRISARWRPIVVEFEHDISDREAALSQFFGAPIIGNCAANVLRIANSDIDLPLRARFDPADGDVAPILERHLLELLSPTVKVPQTCAARVSNVIAKRLGHVPVSIELIADEMNISIRSLRRHLANEGTSFREILQKHRRTTIETILRADGARLKDLASRVSYSDSAVLSRAFKSWTGSSPRKYAESDGDD